jgi:hypothetical protein
VDVVGQRVQLHAVLLAVVKEPAPVVGDDGLLIVLLDGVVATIEKVAPVVGNHVGSDSRGLGRNRDTPGCLPRGPPCVEVVEELANGVEDELRVERHGDTVRKIDQGRKLQGSNESDTNC